jgi:Protein of unknown function (DUF2891)
MKIVAVIPMASFSLQPDRHLVIKFTPASSRCSNSFSTSPVIMESNRYVSTEHPGMRSRLTAELATTFATIALAHVTREYPGKMDHILTGPSDVQSPRALHPAFYGSFDWHSCVHGFWLLAKILRLFPDLLQAPKIRELFERQLSATKVAGELSYLERPMQENFERPYGWAWLLMLESELAQHITAESKIWCKNLRPLSQAFSERFKKYLPKLPYPIRAGTHPNTAFAAALAIEYAQVCKDAQLLEVVCARAKEFYGSDTDCQTFEPSGNDFHSPTLIEMECMRRALDRADFLNWLERFLPQLAERKPRILFEPVAVSDHADPQIAHLDGLNFSRAWCWRMLANDLPAGDARREIALDAAESHILQSLPHIAADYMGEHWLATYALLALAA